MTIQLFIEQSRIATFNADNDVSWCFAQGRAIAQKAFYVSAQAESSSPSVISALNNSWPIAQLISDANLLKYTEGDTEVMKA